MKPLITIFTPTYNRANLIKNLYDSLLNQECKDFEWIIVDDDSTDDTRVFFDCIKSEDTGFSITYMRQAHGGKHRAINRGVKIARGKYFFIVDSDDCLLPYSIKIVKNWIKDSDSNSVLAGVSGICQKPDGSIVGEFPTRRISKKRPYIDVKNTDRYLFKLMGDKAEIYRTELLKSHPFPEFDNEFFVTESVCWNILAGEGYKIRWYNIPIYVCEYHPDGLTNTGVNRLKGHQENYQGYCYQVKCSLRQCRNYEAVTFFREYNNTALYLGKNLDERAHDIGLSKISYMLYMGRVPYFYFWRIVIKLVRRTM